MFYYYLVLHDPLCKNYLWRKGNKLKSETCTLHTGSFLKATVFALETYFKSSSRKFPFIYNILLSNLFWY